MNNLLKKSITILSMSISAVSVANTPESDSKLNLTLLVTVSGSITDYYPNLFDNFSVTYTSAFNRFMWAGNLYLKNNSPSDSMMDGMKSHYDNSITLIENTAVTICREKFEEKGIQTGYIAIDHAFVTPVYAEGYSNFIYGGNYFCLTKI